MSKYIKSPRDQKVIKENKTVVELEHPLILCVQKSNCGICMVSKRFIDKHNIPNICYSKQTNMRVLKSAAEAKRIPTTEKMDVVKYAKEMQGVAKNPKIPMLVDPNQDNKVIVGTHLIELHVRTHYIEK